MLRARIGDYRYGIQYRYRSRYLRLTIAAENLISAQLCRFSVPGHVLVWDTGTKLLNT